MDFQNEIFSPAYSKEFISPGCTQQNDVLKKHSPNKFNVDEEHNYSKRRNNQPAVEEEDNDQWVDLDEDGEEDKKQWTLQNAIEARKKIRALNKRAKILRRKIKEKEKKQLEEMTDEDVIEYFSNRFNDTQMEFFKMQLQNPVEEHKRTYSSAQKDIALALYRDDPEGYLSTRSIFVLPDEVTLENHSNISKENNGKPL